MIAAIHDRTVQGGSTEQFVANLGRAMSALPDDSEDLTEWDIHGALAAATFLADHDLDASDAIWIASPLRWLGSRVCSRKSRPSSTTATSPTVWRAVSSRTSSLRSRPPRPSPHVVISSATTGAIDWLGDGSLSNAVTTPRPRCSSANAAAKTWCIRPRRTVVRRRELGRSRSWTSWSCRAK